MAESKKCIQHALIVTKEQDGQSVLTDCPHFMSIILSQIR